MKEKVIGQDYYTNKQNDIDVKLPSKIKENKGITFKNGKTNVDFIPQRVTIQNVLLKRMPLYKSIQY